MSGSGGVGCGRDVAELVSTIDNYEVFLSWSHLEHLLPGKYRAGPIL